MIVAKTGIRAGGWPVAQILLRSVAAVSYHYQPKGQRRLWMRFGEAHPFRIWQQRGKAAVPLLSYFGTKLHSSQEAAVKGTGEDRSCAGWQSAFYCLANYS